MIIFVYGDDTFGIQEKVGVMKKAFKKKFDPTGMNTATFPPSIGGKLSVADVFQSVRSLPFLGEKRMVIIRDLVSTVTKDTQDLWIEGLSKTPDSTIVILSESMGSKDLERRSIYKKLKDKAETHVYSFPELKGSALIRWGEARIKAQGGVIGRLALQALIERVGSDLWQMSHEIEKLVAYSNGVQIEISMVDDLVRTSFEGQIFALVDAISKKQSNKAIRLLQEERLSGANDHYLITMLARQVRILLGVCALLEDNPRATKQDVAGALDIHPFVASKALIQARGFKLEDLKQTHDLLFAFDTKIKTGQVSTKMAVDLVTVDLLG